MNEYQCIVMGAAGRDFHIFLSFLRGNQQFRVKAFTATQIPFIDQRSFPLSLAGPGYDGDIPIYDESELPRLIQQYDVDFVFFAYSDIPHADIMHKASLVQAAGASFVMLGPDHTQLASAKPVVSVTATRTGAGKSPLTQWLARLLTDRGKRIAVIRHPMPYGNLDMQRVQRFANPADLSDQQCTIEEREEYEPYVDMGIPIYAGVDYQAILDKASADADIVLWDGGNNDFSFYPARPRYRRGGRPARRSRDRLFSGRSEFPACRRVDHQQVRLGPAGRGGWHSRTGRALQPAGRDLQIRPAHPRR